MTLLENHVSVVDCTMNLILGDYCVLRKSTAAYVSAALLVCFAEFVVRRAHRCCCARRSPPGRRVRASAYRCVTSMMKVLHDNGRANEPASYQHLEALLELTIKQFPAEVTGLLVRRGLGLSARHLLYLGRNPSGKG